MNRKKEKRFVSIRSNRQHFQRTLHRPIFSKTRTNRLPALRIDTRGSDSCRFDRIESNRQHFQPTLCRPGKLQFVRLLQIDFRYNESTARETIRVDSNLRSYPPSLILRRGEGGRIFFPFFPKKEKNTSDRRLCRFVRIESNRQHFQPTMYRPGTLYFLSIAQIDFQYNELTARGTIRVDSFESNRIDNIFNPPRIDPGSYIF